MERTPAAFAHALSSGEPEQVNRTIDEVTDIKPEGRADLFDACFEVCRELYEAADGYQRQSAVRFAAALYPRLEYQTVGTQFTDDALPNDYTVDETTTHRDRLRELYLKALVDDDGRVRRAAAKAVTELALTAAFIQAEAELQAMLEELDTLASRQSEPHQKHIEQAYENVAMRTELPAVVPAEIRNAGEQSEQSGSSDES